MTGVMVCRIVADQAERLVGHDDVTRFDEELS
jgi:hypothetical protein